LNAKYLENLIHFGLKNNVLLLLPKKLRSRQFESEQLIPRVVARGEGEEHSPLPVPNHKELRQGHVLGHLGVKKYTCSGHKIGLRNNQRE
jgi:hypothetical protein